MLESDPPKAKDERESSKEKREKKKRTSITSARRRAPGPNVHRRFEKRRHALKPLRSRAISPTPTNICVRSLRTIPTWPT